jgi:hypothetical protein
MSQLIKPLFVNGNFNREGTRIRANNIKTIGVYSLWVSDGKPDKDYVQNEEDKYYLYILTNDYLVPIGYTMFELKRKAGYNYLNKQWYGSFTEREKFFDNIRNSKTDDENWNRVNALVNEQITKEEEFIKQQDDNEIMLEEFLKVNIDNAIADYIDVRDNSGTRINWHGAAFLGDLARCEEIAKVIKQQREEKEQERKRLLKEQKQKEVEERAQAEKVAIEEAEKTFTEGGKIDNGDIIIKLANKYDVKIPLRTKGWIIDCLANVTITVDGNMNYQFYKKKGATGSQTIWTVLKEIKSVITKQEVTV